ncbi:hypothetical protein [Halostagnicola larsenii]|uniref:hypothetical protein n=1 Tax=Halostagnicola larsenii TaxID=353800 RepID=UPI001F5691F1|nr:hypothetical protein [Halostagnicola larsenii]
MQNDAIALRLRRLEEPPDGHAAPERGVHLPAVELVADAPQRREPVRKRHGVGGRERVSPYAMTSPWSGIGFGTRNGGRSPRCWRS